MTETSQEIVLSQQDQAASLSLCARIDQSVKQCFFLRACTAASFALLIVNAFLLTYSLIHSSDSEILEETWFVLLDIIVSLGVVIEVGVEIIATRKSYSFRNCFHLLDIFAALLCVASLVTYAIRQGSSSSDVPFKNILLAVRYSARVGMLLVTGRYCFQSCRDKKNNAENRITFDSFRSDDDSPIPVSDLTMMTASTSLAATTTSTPTVENADENRPFTVQIEMLSDNSLFPTSPESIGIKSVSTQAAQQPTSQEQQHVQFAPL
eukprot:TRINITY_DN2156_c0_g1_i1.p1 TRINITY_DN2156_c0_g1~~TRINITY_DN2156_c0_g1_i1.p1  ORF type:complete len:265 (-),score=43.48 TRINITY_DN2156_c0_g1_i1:249-1043(-)